MHYPEQFQAITFFLEIPVFSKEVHYRERFQAIIFFRDHWISRTNTALPGNDFK